MMAAKEQHIAWQSQALQITLASPYGCHVSVQARNNGCGHRERSARTTRHRYPYFSSGEEVKHASDCVESLTAEVSLVDSGIEHSNRCGLAAEVLWKGGRH